MKLSSSPIQKVLFISFAILLPLVILSTSLMPWRQPVYIITAIADISYPIQSLISSSVVGMKKWIDDYLILQDTADENRELRADLEKLLIKLMDYNEKERQVASLRQLLQLSEQESYSSVATEMISGDNHLPFQTVLISGGRNRNIRPGMAVINVDGLIGKVLRSGLLHSDVIFLTDTSFNVDVLVQRTRERGTVEGMGRNSCILKLERRSDVKIGDLIVTSGLVGGYPKGIPVGEVSKIIFENDQVSQKIIVKPNVDLGRIDFAMVVLKEDRDLSKIEDITKDMEKDGAVF